MPKKFKRPMKPVRIQSPFQGVWNALKRVCQDVSRSVDSAIDKILDFFENVLLRLFNKRAYKEKRLNEKVEAFEKKVRSEHEEPVKTRSPAAKRKALAKIEEPETLTAQSEKIKLLMNTAEKIHSAEKIIYEGQNGEEDLKGRQVSIHSYSTLTGALKIFEESRRTILSESLREQMQLLRSAEREAAELNDALERAFQKVEDIDVADITEMDDLRLTTLARVKVVLEEVKRRVLILDAALADFKSLQALMLSERETLDENLEALEEAMSEL